ncbi:MAG: sigma-70 family RNA polymerase sigma factor [Cytophagales bacterium]|nr:sigma-70 family RNA polymerase sigma factor [Cytophagales bacterium]
MISLKTIELLQQGDQNACRKVFESFGDQFIRVAKRYLSNDGAAEDMVTNAFVKIFRNVSKSSFENERSFVAWMKRILINECLMELRKRNSFQMVPDDVLETVAIEPDIIQDMQAEEIMNQVKSLPPGYRTVFNMYVVEGFSHAEIAKELGISEGTSKSQLSHAKKLLRSKMISIYGKEAGNRN